MGIDYNIQYKIVHYIIYSVCVKTKSGLDFYSKETARNEPHFFFPLTGKYRKVLVFQDQKYLLPAPANLNIAGLPDKRKSQVNVGDVRVVVSCSYFTIHQSAYLGFIFRDGGFVGNVN